MKISAIFAATMLGACFLQAQELKTSGEARKAWKILDSQEVDMGNRKIIYNRVEAPKLKPAPIKLATVPAKEAPMTAEEEAELRNWEAKFQYAPFFEVTVYDGQFSEVRWRDEGKENVIWSNINFLHFAPLVDLETATAYYWIMMSGWETTTASVKAMNASAQSGEELNPLPPPTLPTAKKSGPRWIAAGTLSENAKRVMNDFHSYYRLNGPEMAKVYKQREKEAKAQEEWLKAHPPIPQDTVVNFFPIRSTASKTTRPGKTGK